MSATAGQPPDYLDCLVATASFETLWAYYWQSDGSLFDEECRRAAQDVVRAVRRILQHDASILQVRSESPATTVEGPPNASIVDALDEWSMGARRFPHFDADEGAATSDSERGFANVWLLTSTLLMNSVEALGGSRYGMSMLSAQQPEYTAGWLRWKAHLPDRVLRTLHGDDILAEMSAATSISVIGDIKRSQDLMTYARDSQQFSDRISTFTERIRELSDAYGGMFDKFTGDGFLVYFSEVLTAKVGLSYTDAFVHFICDVRDYSVAYFDDWCKVVRKRPAVQVGLALGADIGQIEFQDRRNNLIAVGDAIVWSSRMASSAGAGNILVNNLLAAELRSLPDLALTPVAAETKTGEDFLAYHLEPGDSWKGGA